MTSDDDDDDLVSFVSRDIALGANTANENLGILLRGRFLFVFPYRTGTVHVLVAFSKARLARFV
jgi:hypothetical protein